MKSRLSKIAFASLFALLVLVFQNLTIPEADLSRLTAPEVFNCAFYAKSYPDTLNKTCDQLKAEYVSLLKNGITRKAHPLFSVEEYLKNYPELNTKYRSNPDMAVSHYIDQGISQKLAGLVLLKPEFFNCEFYQQSYVDLQTPEFDCERLKKHWLNHGAKGGRAASSEFSMRRFLKETKPILGEFFGENYKLAWDYYTNFELTMPFVVRPLDLRQENLFSDSSVVVKVNSQKNDYSSILSAIESARSLSKSGAQKVTIKFASGAFYIDCAASATTNCFELTDLKNITFSGDNSGKTRLVMLSPEKGLFKIKNSSDVYFRNLTIDYKTSPFIQGSVLEVNSDQGFIKLKIDNSFEHIDLAIMKKYLSNSFGYLMDPKIPERKMATDSFFRASNITANTSGDIWDLTFELLPDKKVLEQAQVGDRIAFPISVPGASGISFFNSINVGLDQITMYAGFVNYIFDCSGDLIFNRLNIRRPPGENRLVSLSRGVFNASNNRSPILLQNSYFEASGDDQFNLNASDGYVSEIGPDSKTIKTILGGAISAGDMLQFVDPYSGKWIGNIKVVSTSSKGWLTLESEVSLIPGTRLAPGTIFFNLNNAAQGSIFRNNIFGPNRRAQLLVRAYATVEENRFLHADSNAILAHINLSGVGRNGPLIDNLNIKRNIFNQGKEIGSPLVNFALQTINNGHAITNYGSVLIENNTFVNCSAECTKFSSFGNLNLVGNKVINDSKFERIDYFEPLENRTIFSMDPTIQIMHNDTQFFDFRAYSPKP